MNLAPPRVELPAALRARLQAAGDAAARLVVAVDGPAGSGKSTTARCVATLLGLRHLDTGAMYRALTLAARRRGVDTGNEAALLQLAERASIRLEATPEGTRVFLEGEDVTDAVRTEDVTTHVSQVSAHPGVRRWMLERQRQLATAGGIVMDGRDIGTVVLPDADLKVFLTADPRTRAMRRHAEERARGLERSLESIEAEITARDHRDSTRAVAPLRPAVDAVHVDTSDRSIAEQVIAVVEAALEVIESRERLRAADPARDLVDPGSWAQPGFRPYPHLHYRLAATALRGLARLALGAQRQLHPTARPRGSVLVASNHISMLDPPVVGSLLPFEVAWVAKSELFRNRWVGGLLRRFNAFPIERGTADYAALDHAVELLRQGLSVLMFPEGTRQRPGRLGSPRWGFGYVAARARRPIVPVFVRGTRDRRPRPWRRQPLEVWIGAAMDPGTPVDDDPESYRELGARVLHRIEGLMLRSAARRPLEGLEPLATADGFAAGRLPGDPDAPAPGHPAPPGAQGHPTVDS